MVEQTGGSAEAFAAIGVVLWMIGALSTACRTIVTTLAVIELRDSKSHGWHSLTFRAAERTEP